MRTIPGRRWAQRGRDARRGCGEELLPLCLEPVVAFFEKSLPHFRYEFSCRDPHSGEGAGDGGPQRCCPEIGPNRLVDIRVPYFDRDRAAIRQLSAVNLSD